MLKAPRTHTATVLIIACLSIVAIAASWGSAEKSSDNTNTIDTSGPVAISQCTSCHYDLDAFKNDRLIFSHNDHFLSGVNCPVCHTSFPHGKDGTKRPPMQVCMQCHNLHGTLQHAMQTDCRECHPAQMDLKPRFHIAVEWVENLHVGSAEKDTGYCLMCHKENDCKTCHVQRGIKERPDNFYKKQLSFTDTPYPAFTIDLKEQVEISSCQPCHADLEAFKNPGLIFNHKAHFAKGIKCFSCHQEWPHSRKGIAKPSMDVCYGCHGLTHAGNGVVAPEECTLCHPPDFNLKPSSHTPEFIAGKHKEVAGKQYFTCMTCHDDKEFCAPCHTSMKVTPNSHKVRTSGVQTLANADWTRSHGKNIDYDYCSLCHDNAFCTKCHRTTMPHNIMFVATHKDYARGMRQDCSICHQDKGTCSSCHHKFEQRDILVASTCNNCHEEVNRPLLEVGNKGLMVHKAHFEMTNTAPFSCDKCHAASYAQDKRCFQFELCYSCHGRYRADKLIAKWPGSQLCYRCHPQNR